MNWKLLFGTLSIIPAAIAYFIYFKHMLAGKTKPHAFSWLIWGLLAANGFIAQVSAHAGIGAWTTGITSVASFAVFAFALHLGTTNATQSDKALLALALAGLLLLPVVDDKEIALCITLTALIIGFAMTVRKAYHKPHEENAMSFLLNTLKFAPAILALNSFSFLTLAYPLVAVSGNAAVVLVVYVRGRQVHAKKQGVPGFVDPS
jgi:hypothetical protein